MLQHKSSQNYFSLVPMYLFTVSYYLYISSCWGCWWYHITSLRTLTVHKYSDTTVSHWPQLN